MKKRFLSLALALILTLAFVPAASASGYTMVIQPTYEAAEYFSEGLAAVRLNDKWGYIDKAGNVAIAFKYDYAGPFSSGIAYADVIDYDAEVVISYHIDKSGNVTRQWETPLDELYEGEHYYFSEGLSVFLFGELDEGGKYGYVDEDFNTVIPPRFDYAYDFHDGVAAVMIDEKWGYIDKAGNDVIPFRYDWALSFCNGLASVSINDKWGYINKAGNTVIELIYDVAYDFYDDWAVVGNGGKFGYIDKTGKVVIPLQFDLAIEFSGDYAPVRFGDYTTGKWGFIDKTGKLVVSPEFDDVNIYYYNAGFQEGLAAVKVGGYSTGKWGFIAIDLANPPPAGPLDGAAEWAKPELEQALEIDLIFEEMIGKWTQPTDRTLAAKVIVYLIESLTGVSIDVIAEELGFDMNDKFIDTDVREVTFLKASGISNGVDGVRYDPTGIFNRAQMVTMLGRMAKFIFEVDTDIYPKGSEKFTDVPDWADEFVGWAVDADITRGVSDTLFDPYDTLSNQHTGIFTYRAFKNFSQ